MNRITATLQNGCFGKWMIIRLTLYQTTTLPKWMVSKKLFFKSSLLLNGLSGIQFRPPSNSDDICLLLRLYFSSMYPIHNCHTEKLGKFIHTVHGHIHHTVTADDSIRFFSVLYAHLFSMAKICSASTQKLRRATEGKTCGRR